MRTVIRYDSNELPLGLRIDEEFLGFQTTTIKPRIELMYRFKKRHAIDAEYYSVERYGVRSVEVAALNGLNLKSPTLELRTSFQHRILRVSYVWIFHSDNKVMLGLSPGIYVSQMSIAFKSLESLDILNQASKFILPLPVVGFRLGYRLADRLGLLASTNTFFLTYQGYKGIMTESSLFIEHKTFKHFGFGAGVVLFPMYITYEEEQFTTDFRNTYFGAVLYASLYF